MCCGRVRIREQDIYRSTTLCGLKRDVTEPGTLGMSHRHFSILLHAFLILQMWSNVIADTGGSKSVLDGNLEARAVMQVCVCVCARAHARLFVCFLVSVLRVCLRL